MLALELLDLSQEIFVLGFDAGAVHGTTTAARVETLGA